MTQDCTTIDDRQCVACHPGQYADKNKTTQQCVDCLGSTRDGEGSTWDGDNDAGTPCIPCTRCTAGERRTRKCTATADAKCEDCVRGVSFSALVLGVRRCAACGVCDPAKKEIVAGHCTQTANTNCMNCNDQTWVDPDPDSATECQPCIVCFWVHVFLYEIPPDFPQTGTWHDEHPQRGSPRVHVACV